MTQLNNKLDSRILNPAVIVAALGNFVDVFDLVLFAVVRVRSLKELGFTPEQITNEGTQLLDWQMGGMLLGGILWGIMGDKKGRLSVLFASIFTYSIANIANGFVETMEMYIFWRFIAGIGLAGELGAGITLVTEVMPKEKRGYGAMIVAALGLLGAVAAKFVVDALDWRIAYYIGGGMGLLLLVLRISVQESQMFEKVKSENRGTQGNFLALFRCFVSFDKKDWDLFSRYARCVLMGVPIWYVIGILIHLSPEFGRELGIHQDVDVGYAVMISYGGAALGDLLSGTISQFMRSRIKVMIIFLCLDATASVVYHFIAGWDLHSFYSFFFFFGIGGGFWLMLLTISAEQFGTNIRATVTTTVPNFVRGSVIAIHGLFHFLRIPHTIDFSFIHSSMVFHFDLGFTFIQSSMIVGAIVFVIAILSAISMRETFGKDMNFTEDI